MEYTQNYKFRLPADSDIIDIGDIDENFINVDTLIAALRSDKADKNSPNFTGTPKSTTPTSSDNSTRIATTAFVQALVSSLQTAVNASIADKADKNSPSLTGTPKSTTPTSSDNSTRIATTEFVQALISSLQTAVNSSITTLQEEMTSELQSVTISSSLELISASGKTSFYHGTLSGFFDDSSLLGNVQTSFGQAAFGTHYGSFSAQPGSEIALYVRIYFDGTAIRWDEYYNDYYNATDVIYIGTATVSDYEAGGSTTCEFSYYNANAQQPKEYSLRDAIIELAKQIQYLNKG